MTERVTQPKKASTGSFSIPAFKQPRRGFGLDSPGTSSQTVSLVQPLNKPLGHDISRISLRSQTKLTVNQPGDVYEQSADRVPGQVVQRMSEPVNQQFLQREALPEEEEELQMKSLADSNISLQREALPEEEEELQMKSLTASPQAVNGMQPLNKPLTHDISRMSLRRPQTKLTVNQPGDIYEQSADRVAGQVMQRMSEPGNRHSIQREALPESEDQLQMKSLADSITPIVQRKGRGGIAATSELESSIQQARGNGQPLGDDIKQPMEQAFGADFGSVRVHTDAQSNSLNQSIQARAFTTGQDVFFRQGEYSPESNAGKELLAHELTHVVQQNGSAVQPKSLHAAPKGNKLQTKLIPTTSAGNRLPIQLRENSQKPAEEDNQKNSEAVESKTDIENGEQQNQATTQKPQATPTPPDDKGNGATDPPPTKKVDAAVESSGNPSATQKQIEGNQPKQPESKDTKANTEKVDSQQQTKNSTGLPGADPVLPGGNAGKAIAVLPGANTTKTAVKLLDAAVGGKAPTSPNDDPAFQAVVGTAKEVAGQQKKHAPANSKAQEAQAAAQPPGNEVDSKAQANQVGEMQQAPTPGFDAAAFKAKLMERIADMAPKNLQEADDFKNNNKLDSIKGDLSGKVKEEQKSSQSQVEEKTKEKPDTSGIEAKQVTPLPSKDPGAPPAAIGADQAAPKSKGQGEVEAPLQDDSKKLDQQMNEADITDDQLANSNEPEFQGALTAKKDAQTNAQEAPPQYRQQEQGILATAQATAEATAQQHLQAMHGIRTQNLGQVGEQQVGAKSKDEQARAKVAGDINKIYDSTKGKVEKTLSELDGQVIQAFDTGAADAKKAFEDYVGKRMDEYKDDRYSGFWGPAKWLKDKLFGMPSEVNAFYEDGRQLYINQMDGVINNVVAIISKGLTQAKGEIASGKLEIQNYVNQLPQDLKGAGQQAAADIDSKFEELQQSVDDKQNELIDTLAQKYKENLDAVDARIEEMKAANKGFIQKAFDFIVGVIKTIIELTKMLLEVLARVAGVVGQILKNPIGFLTNLIQAVKQGFLNFMNNIGKHLQQGLIGWLTGTMAETGIQMPENLDLKGIFSLAMQLLGFTYEAIRAQAVKRLGEEKVCRLEQTVEIFQVLASKGVAGMWEFVQEKMGDLNALVIEPIKNFIIEKVITAGIEWVLSLLTPASAFIKAAQGIYEIVKFFMERAQQIADLINAILDAIGAIASGAIDQAIKGVENALAKSLPVVISFLASLLGLDGIAGKIQAIFQKLRKPMEKAVDWVIDKGSKAFKAVGNKVKNSKLGKKAGKLKDSAKEKYQAGKQWVEDKKEAGQNWVNDKKATAEQWVEGKKEGVKNKFKNSKFGKKIGAVTESAKEKYQAGKQWVEDKKEAGQNWVNDKKEAAQNWIEGKKKSVKDKFDKFGNKVKDKLGFGKDKEKGKEEQNSKENTSQDKRSDEVKKKDLVSAEKTLQGIISKSESTKEVERHFPAIKKEFGLKKLEWDKLGTPSAAVIMEINPRAKIDLSGSDLLLNEGDITHSNQFKQDVTFKEGIIDGKYKVGKQMEAKKLGANHPQGSGPDSSLDKLMRFLPTDTSNKNEDKFIRGHLLNDHLGGSGQYQNLYPITADANEKHESQIESVVKNWVNNEGFWVYYKVEVIEKKVDITKGEVNADLICEAARLDTDGNKAFKGALKVTIHSQAGQVRSHTSNPIDKNKYSDKDPTPQDSTFDKSKVELSARGGAVPMEVDSTIKNDVEEINNLLTDVVGNQYFNELNQAMEVVVGNQKDENPHNEITFNILTNPEYRFDDFNYERGDKKLGIWNAAIKRINDNSEIRGNLKKYKKELQTYESGNWYENKDNSTVKKDIVSLARISRKLNISERYHPYKKSSKTK
ncbi:MAG: DUF4157 domain-containing protein [Nostoc sp.]|uniref:eCIS core domain-containing protein n=1 Tax=Nostoc sp. TaxID=1180 RepID=UPI002FF631C3